MSHAFGRENELRRLDEALAAGGAGERRVVLVTGETGIGKSTLVEAFTERAAAAGHVGLALGRCIEQRGAPEPYMPLLDALGTLGQGPLGDRLARVIEHAAPTWVPHLPALFGNGEVEPNPLPAPPTAARMLREMAEALEALAGGAGLVLVLEDLHWSDASTLDLVSLLARREPARLLLVATLRPGEQAERLGEALGGRGRCVEIALGPLGPDAVADYVGMRLPGSGEIAPLLHQGTGGDPLFLRCLVDSWPVEAIPSSARALIEHELAELDDADRHVLEAACVAGLEQSAAATAAAAGIEVEEAERRCAALARFLGTRGSVTWPDGTVAGGFGFVHELHREAIRDAIPPARLARMHRDVGARIEAAFGARSVERAGELADHFARAQQPVRAVGYLRDAADQAMARGAHADAVPALRTALDLLGAADPEDAERLELPLQSALAAALVATEGWDAPAAEQAYLRARELAERDGDGRQLASVLYGLATLYEYRGDHARSEALVEERLALTLADELPASVVEAHELLAGSLFHQGEFEEAVAHADRGLALAHRSARHSGPAFRGEDPGASCHDWAGLALWCLGRGEQAVERIEAALEIAERPGRAYGRANARVHAARLQQLRGDPAAALALAGAAARLAREQGFPYQEAAAMMLAGWARARLGWPEAGLRELLAGLSAHGDTGAQLDRPYFLALLAEGLHAAGRFQEGLDAVEEALAMVGDGRPFFYEAELHRLDGELLFALRGAEASELAERSLRTAVDVARAQGARSLERRAAESLDRLKSARLAPPS